MKNIVPHSHKNNIPVFHGDELYELPVSSLPAYPFYDDEGIYYDSDAPYNPREILERPIQHVPLTLNLPKTTKPKKPITLRIDEDLLQALKGKYPKGYQTKINDILRDAMGI